MQPSSAARSSGSRPALPARSSRRRTPTAGSSAVSSKLASVASRGRGGRTSSSRPSAHDDPLVFDHGCQFFTASDPEFKAVCASLVRSGHASRWDGRFGTLDARTGAFASRDAARGDVPPDEDFFRLLSADEVFVTGTFGGLTPVREVDGRTIGGGAPARPMTARLTELYRDAVEADVRARS